MVDRGTQGRGALSHLRVVEAGNGVAIQYCGRLLSGFGADVIKIEEAGGSADRRAWRRVGTDGSVAESPAFAYLNQGKRSCVIRERGATGEALLHSIAERADIILCGADDLSRFEALAQDASQIVVVISDFGLDGPYSHFKANEMILQAVGGLMYLIGYGDREPVREAHSQSLILAGITGALAALSAVRGRRVDGKGDVVDVSVHECLASTLQASLMYYTFLGGVRTRTASPSGGLNEISPAREGYVIPMLGGYGHWDALVAFFGDPLLADERFQTHSGRLRHGEELARILVRCLSERDKFEVFHSGQEWGFPFGVVQEPDDLLSCPQLAFRGFWEELYPGLKVPGAPFRLSGTPWRNAPPPQVGEHTREILAEFCGLDDFELDALEVQGVTN